MTDDTGPEAEWLNMTRAAHRLGWPRERLRGLVRRHRLQTMRGNSGEMLVRMTPELLAQAAPGPPHGSASPGSQGQPPRAAHGPAYGPEEAEAGILDELRNELLDVRERAAGAEREVRVLREAWEREKARADELQAVRADLDRLAQELMTISERAARAEGAVPILQNALIDLARRLDRAEERLAQSWWRWLFG
jgi:hypothetical protein